MTGVKVASREWIASRMAAESISATRASIVTLLVTSLAVRPDF
jgi:hypothetical protein